MSRHRAQQPAEQAVDVLPGVDMPGGTVDTTGRLLSVAELQDALRLARQRSHPPASPVIPQRRRSRVRVQPHGAPDPVREPSNSASDDRPEPDNTTTPAGQQVPSPSDVDEPAPPDPQWGANPVPVAGISRHRPVLFPQRSTPPAATGTAAARFPVAELLRRPPRDREIEAGRVLAGRWPGPRRVVFASLTGGAGRSTLVAVLSAAAVDVGVPVLVVDGTGGDPRSLMGRIGPGAAVSRRDWTRLSGVEAEADFAALHRRAGSGGPAVMVVPVGGEQGFPPPAGAVAAGAEAAARTWPLVLVDLPHGEAATRAAVRAGGFDLLVLLCRADPAEITDATGFLTDLAADGGVDCAQRAVIAVRAERRGLPGSVRRRLAAVSDCAAGPLTVTHVSSLTGRRNPAQGPDAVAAGRLLLAAAASAPPLDPPKPDEPPVEQIPATAAASTLSTRSTEE